MTSEVTVPRSSTGAARHASAQPMDERAAQSSSPAAAASCGSAASLSAQERARCNRASAAASFPADSSCSPRKRSWTNASMPSHRGSSGPAKGNTTRSTSARTTQCCRRSPVLALLIMALNLADAALPSPPSSGSGGSWRMRSSPTPPCRSLRHSSARGSHMVSPRMYTGAALSSSSTFSRPPAPPTFSVCLEECTVSPVGPTTRQCT
mmetsp:Transcript_49931/g.129604  ORF Transcript_49931/g.129604 Transcript_49931/m.129604 type:complete len:208 (-) Transcript_49931:1075-1698(-)